MCHKIQPSLWCMKNFFPQQLPHSATVVVLGYSFHMQLGILFGSIKVKVWWKEVNLAQPALDAKDNSEPNPTLCGHMHTLVGLVTRVRWVDPGPEAAARSENQHTICHASSWRWKCNVMALLKYKRGELKTSALSFSSTWAPFHHADWVKEAHRSGNDSWIANPKSSQLMSQTPKVMSLAIKALDLKINYTVFFDLHFYCWTPPPFPVRGLPTLPDL